MSFIKDITSNHLDKVIVETIIALGKGLELSLVAEGVETKEQYHLLYEMKCDKVQGFLFSKPVPSETLIDML